MTRICLFTRLPRNDVAIRKEEGKMDECPFVPNHFSLHLVFPNHLSFLSFFNVLFFIYLETLSLSLSFPLPASFFALSLCWSLNIHFFLSLFALSLLFWIFVSMATWPFFLIPFSPLSIADTLGRLCFYLITRVLCLPDKYQNKRETINKTVKQLGTRKR